MYEIVTILGIIYLLYRIRFFYKEGNYNQVKSFISILIFITTVLVLKQFYDYKYISFDTYYFISIVIGLIFYLLLMGSIVYKYRYTDDKKERKRLLKAFLLGCLPILIYGLIIFLIFLLIQIINLVYKSCKNILADEEVKMRSNRINEINILFCYYILVFSICLQCNSIYPKI